MEQITTEAMTILESATVESDRVVITSAQLARPLYEEVNEVLVRLGGKWKGGKTKAHLFPYDPRPLLQAVIDTACMPEKNPTAFFPTPAVVVEGILNEMGLSEYLTDWRILEPSGGTGAFADAIRAKAPNAHLDVVEILPINASVLRGKGHTVHEMNFLDFKSENLYNTIIMNPPFSVEGDKKAYITHIKHAWELLENHGLLIAIVPTGFIRASDKKSKEFRQFACEYGEWWLLPSEAFKESGTLAQTAVVKLQKETVTRREYNGWHCWHCWVAELWADNTESIQRQREQLRGDTTLDESAWKKKVTEFYDRVSQESPDCIYLTTECHAELQRFLREDS